MTMKLFFLLIVLISGLGSAKLILLYTQNQILNLKVECSALLFKCLFKC